MKEIIIDIPDELYDKAVKIAKKSNITFDEFCAIGVKRLSEEYKLNELKKQKNDFDNSIQT